MFSFQLKNKFKFSDKETFIYPGQELRPRNRIRHRSSDVMIDGAVREAVETGRTRMMVTAALFAMAYLVIAGRLFDLMVLKSTDSRPPVSQSASVPLDTGRADIVDRNGMVLATNLPTVNLYADSAKIGYRAGELQANAEEAADRLVQILPELNRADLVEKLTSGRRFIYLRRNLTPRQQAAINAAGIPGVYFENSERRVYPQGTLAAHILGATDPDNRGIAGLERTFDQRLKEDSTPVQLSVDLRVQAALRDTLAEAMEKFSAVGAAGVVMDVRTGQIVAMVSLPDYDPADFGNAPKDAQFNRATLGVYEMGSTFKLFNTAMALDSGLVRVTDMYDTSKPLRIARFTINDDHPIRRPQNVAEILVHSSNIGSARMAMTLGPERQKEFLGRLGMLDEAPIELPEKSRPLYPAQWRDISTMTISYGHGIAVTTVNLASGVSALVNGGILHKPTLLLDRQPASAESVAAQEATPETTAAASYPRRVISESTSVAMRQLMRLVVTDGTAKKADVPGYLIGGKTGTAEKVSARGGYDEHSLRTTFAAAFPMDAPRYVVLTVLDEPKGIKSTYGFAASGWNAAPVTGQVVSKIAPLLGVFPRLDAMQPLAPMALAPTVNDAQGLGQNAAWLVGGAR
jgi:cell division protein FtsI (penicillin-binding protein 3)